MPVALAPQPVWCNRRCFPCSKEAGGSDDDVWLHPARGRPFWAPDNDENDEGIPSLRQQVQSARGLSCLFENLFSSTYTYYQQSRKAPAVSGLR